MTVAGSTASHAEGRKKRRRRMVTNKKTMTKAMTRMTRMMKKMKKAWLVVANGKR